MKRYKLKNRCMLALRFIQIGFKKLLVYPLANLLNIASSMLFIVLQYYLWSSIYENNSIQVMSFSSMLVYLVYANVLASLYPSGVAMSVAKLINTGDITSYILRPVSLFTQFFFEELGKALCKLLRVVVLLILVQVLLPISIFQIPMHSYFICILILSFSIYFLIEMIFSMFAFYTKSFWGLNSLKYAITVLFSAQLIPLAFYPQWLQSIIAYLPFKYMFAYPLDILSGSRVSDIDMIMEMLLSLVVLYGIFYLAFRKSVVKLEVQGG